MAESEIEILIERTKKLLKQQSEIFGPFNVDINVQRDENAPTLSTETISESTLVEIPTVQENEESFEEIQESNPLTTEELIEQCSTLQELKQLCEKAEKLKKGHEQSNLVFGLGNEKADLMIIGEAPEEEEEKLGKPFVGEAGNLLDKILASIHFKRSDVYLTHIIKYRLQSNLDSSLEERTHSLPYLLKQIDLVDPKIILCVGRVSATTLLGIDRPLKEMRQKIHPFKNRELMVTYHPAALLRNSSWKRPTWEDVQMLRARYDELAS